MKKIMICGLAALAMLCSSCIHIDLGDYYRFNDVQISEPLTGLDIEWRDSRVDICYWDKPYTRIYDNSDMSAPSYYRMDGGVLVVRDSDNGHGVYGKTLTVCLPEGTVLNYCDIDVVSANVYADVDTKDLDVDSVSGNVWYSTWYAPYEVDIDTTSGCVTIAFPDTFGFTCDFDSVSGGYSSEFRVVIRDGYICYGDMFSSIEVDTVSGNLDLVVNYSPGSYTRGSSPAQPTCLRRQPQTPDRTVKL